MSTAAALINEADGAVSRYVTGPDADLTAVVSLTADGTSGLAWQVINLHGDIVATVPGGTTATAIAAIMTDEFGVVLDATPGQNNTATSRYDWLGGKQRSSNARAGLTLMGVRLYNPATGRFASVDPVPGGNANAYTYPSDPVNQFDTDGRASKGRKLWRWVKKNRGTIFSVGATLTCLVPGVGWAACAVAQGVAYGVRAQQRAANGGGWRKTARANALDGIFTFAALHERGCSGDVGRRARR
ncbi:RHS repeat-associated core domain-containing protein [Kineococcus sp. NPDC059986]|uniref:RHS repeat-associated core domain-containing protein n=1 Tax=Kineococcus sp. NPDC059986 TaxID=3155538 RepID=UPI00344B6EB3